VHGTRSQSLPPTAFGGPGAPLPRVLYLTGLDPSLKFGSLEEQILTIACVFRDRGALILPVFQAPLRGRTAAEFSRAGISAAALDLSKVRCRTLAHLLRLAAANDIGMVHWNFYHPANFYVWALSIFMPQLAHVLTDHNSRDLDGQGQVIGTSQGWLTAQAKRLLLRRYRRILGVSEFVRSCLEQQGIWRNISCCRYFVNIERFRPNPAVRAAVRRGLSGDEQFVVLVVAQLIKAKGVDILLRSLASLPQHIVAWVVGEGEERESLRDLSRTLGLEQRVRFLGYCEDVSGLMQGADCLVVPSLWQEAVGLVVLEGMAAGLPVVGSAVGGIPEYIEDGHSGFLVEPGKIGELAERIGWLERDADTRRRFGERGRAVAVDRFALERRLADYLAVYAL
jgi:glycosyltransferase involved in cell wall biosynthesis